MSAQPVQNVKNCILVLSGKGGVGKSTCAVQLAASLANTGKSVGILDIDLCGPSIPELTGLEGKDVLTNSNGEWLPVKMRDRNIVVVSIAFFLESKNDAIIWRGPKKNSMIKQLLTNVQWNNVDYLIIDTPPGTSDEHISVIENIRQCTNVRGAVLVTTPQMISIDDVTRELTLCKKSKIKVLGIIENMAGYVCPNCSECTNIFASGGGENLSKKYEVPFLGRIPIHTSFGMGIDKFVDSEISDSNSSVSSDIFEKIVKVLIKSQ